MKHATGIVSLIGERLKTLARENVAVTEPVSVGNRHVLALCELSLGFGGGGGMGEETGSDEKKNSKGRGGGGGGSTRVIPVAVVVADDGNIRVESLK